MTAREAPESLAAALALLQTRLPKVGKDKTAEVGQYSYKYADLASISDALLPMLGELGLSWSAFPTLIESGEFVLEYRLLHVSGEKEVGRYPLPKSGTPQAIGSAITYARRYSLCSVTGLAPDVDDDGAAATAAHGQAQRQEPAPPAVDPVEVEAWMDQWTEMVTAATTREELTALWKEMVRKQKAQFVTAAETEGLAAHWKGRSDKVIRDEDVSSTAVGAA